jgi:signal transduction histidine kinase
MSDVLMESSLTPDQHEIVSIIKHSGDALLVLIEDILFLSKIEAGKLHVVQKPFNVREYVESAMDVIAVSAAQKGISLNYMVQTFPHRHSLHKPVDLRSCADLPGENY